MHFSPAKVESELEREGRKAVVISSPTYISTHNIMHFCTTHPLKLRTGNDERKWSFLVLHIHANIIHF